MSDKILDKKVLLLGSMNSDIVSRIENLKRYEGIAAVDFVSFNHLKNYNLDRIRADQYDTIVILGSGLVADKNIVCKVKALELKSEILVMTADKNIADGYEMITVGEKGLREGLGLSKEKSSSFYR